MAQGKRLDAYEKWDRDNEKEQMLSLIQSASMQGKSMEAIAADVNLSGRQLHTLANRHASVASALKKGRKSVVAHAQSSLMKQIASGNTAATIYALKVYGGEMFNDRARAEQSLGVEDLRSLADMLK